MLDFLNMIKNNWIGLVVGIVAAALISIVIGFTAFKNNKLAGSIISIILIIVFAFAGMFIQSSFFDEDSSTPPITAGEIGSILDTTIKDNWSNTNGGFTFEQIIAAQDDNECPTYEDQIIELKLHDFENYVAFSYYDGMLYQNAIFLKTNAGLVYDGMLNMTGDFAQEGRVQWYPPFYWYVVLLDEWTWTSEKDKEPYYYQSDNGPGGYTYDDLVSLSSQDASFMRYDHMFQIGWGECESRALANAGVLVGTNITDYFINFGPVELVGTKETASRDINTFYNYLYDQIKGNNYGQSKLIDCTGLMCVPIPEELQSNYPVSEDFKEQFPDVDYYGVYNCDIAVNLQYVQGNEQIPVNSNSYDYIDANKDKDIVAVDPVETKESLTKVTLNFVDTGNSNLTNVDLLQTPVTIQFTADEINTTKTITVDSLSEVQNGVDVIFNSHVTWDYIIDSDALLFEDFMGAFTPTGTPSIVEFEYYYMDNYTIVNVGLNPIGTIDTSLINLSQYPVRVILTNETDSFQFLFNNNSQLNTYVSQLMPLGEYEYTILSEQLLFPTLTGKLRITTTDRTMLFNYSLLLESSDLDITMSLSTSPSSFLLSEILFCLKSSSLGVLSEKYNGLLDVSIEMSIYDADGKYLFGLSVVLSDFSLDKDLSTGFAGLSIFGEYLEAGETYSAQCRVFDRLGEVSMVYLTNVVSFEYQHNQRFNFNFDVTEVA